MDEALEAVRALVGHELKASREDLVMTTALADIRGWDSNAMVSIIFAIEDRFAFEMTSWEIDALNTIGDFVRLVCARHLHLTLSEA